MTNQFDLIASKVADFTAIYAKFAQQYHLNLNELRILYFIFQKKEAHSKDISLHWSIPPQTITSFCNKFIKKGYLATKLDPTDGRQKLVFFTKEGLSFIQPIITNLTRAEGNAQHNLSHQNLETFFKTFDQIITNLQGNL